MNDNKMTKKQIYYYKHREECIKYSSEWNKNNSDKRKEISKRDNLKRKNLKRKWYESRNCKGLLSTIGSECVLCGTSDRVLSIHHLNGNHSDNTPGNHIVVCNSCHGFLHGKMRGGLNKGNVKCYVV